MPDCEQCLLKAKQATTGLNVMIRTPMFREEKEIVYQDKFTTLYKYTFKCPTCDSIKIVYGYLCLHCNGMGYHCHVHSGTTCSHCKGLGYHEVPESHIEYLKTGKQPKEK